MKRTYQPNNRKRKKNHRFKNRMTTGDRKAALKARRRKYRKALST